MKRLFILIIMIFLFSCEKESLHCYKCETVVNEEVISIITTCGMSESGIGDFQSGLETQAECLTKYPVRTICIKK
jgi:hypothetical protein